MKIVGIDPGKKGYAALLNTDSSSITLHELPLNPDRELDSAALFQILLDFEPEILVTEDVWRPKSLVAMRGEIVCLGKLLQCHIEIVRPQTWKKRVLGFSTDDKQKSIDKCLELYPHLDLRRTPRCKTLSDDKAESVLLAQFYWMNTQRKIK